MQQALAWTAFRSRVSGTRLGQVSKSSREREINRTSPDTHIGGKKWN
jgi:hypothetical protein